MIKFILVFGFSAFAHATPLFCDISNNLSVVYSAKVKSLINEKVLIGNAGVVTAYVTEKNNNIFIVEAFLANQEARIYAQGNLNNTHEFVIASFWNRENIIDVSCHR